MTDIYVTDPTSGRIVPEQKHMSTRPESTTVPQPTHFQPRVTELQIQDNNLDGQASLTLGSLTSSVSDRLRAQYARTQDKALADGIIDSEGRAVSGREREADLTRLQLNNIKAQLAYEHSVTPHLQAERDGHIEVALEDRYAHALQRNALALRNLDAARAQERGHAYTGERPIEQRVMLIDGQWVQVC